MTTCVVVDINDFLKNSTYRIDHVPKHGSETKVFFSPMVSSLRHNMRLLTLSAEIIATRPKCCLRILYLNQ